MRASWIRDMLFKLLKLVFLLKENTENWTTKSVGILHTSYIQITVNLHVRSSRIRDMLFKLLKLVFLLKALLKTGPPSLGILYKSYIYRLQWNLHVRPSRIRDMPFLLKARLKTGPPNLFFLGGYLKQVLLYQPGTTYRLHEKYFLVVALGTN